MIEPLVTYDDLTLKRNLVVGICLEQVSITMNGYMLQADLISIKMKNFDIILGMDLLAKNNAINNYFNRLVTFEPKD